MRWQFLIVLLVACAAACLWQPRRAFGTHKLPRPRPQCLPPGSTTPRPCLTLSNVDSSETFDLTTLDGTGNAVVTPFGDDDGDGQIALPIPPGSAAGVAENGTGYFWFFEPTRTAVLAPLVGLAADSPFLTKPDGTPLLVQYRESDYDFVLRLARGFAIGEVLPVTDGTVGGWPGPIVYEMPTSFALEELFTRDPARFPLYTGDAVVADVAYLSVVPEPASLKLLAAIAWMALVVRWR